MLDISGTSLRFFCLIIFKTSHKELLYPKYQFRHRFWAIIYVFRPNTLTICWKGALTDVFVSVLSPYWEISIQLKKCVTWGLIDPPSSKQLSIWIPILLLNTLEINYLHYLIEVNPQSSHLGYFWGAYFDLIKILGVDKVEVPIDIASLFNLTLV